jgi:chromosome transmission fidelity protein 4
MIEPAKNPFAKKIQASNPFAKPQPPSGTGTKALEAIKSTSFFERVDTIESSGIGAGVKTKTHPKRKESGGGKQQTLFPVKVPKESPAESVVTETETPTETEMEMDDGMDVEESEMQEAQAPSIVGESLVCPSPLSLIPCEYLSEMRS